MGKNIVIKNSKINKRGVFAARDIKNSEIVIKWNPKILRKSEVEKLKGNIKKHYLHKVGKNKIFLMQSPEKFVNHSCEANTRVRNNCDVAVRNIKKGEEITSDYGKGGFDSFECKCGSKNCRGFIN